jgi:hypothetical protein
MRMNITSGRHNIWKSRSRATIGISVVLAPAVSSTLPFTVRPLSFTSNPARSAAIRSMTFNCSAFSAVIDALSRTADLAHSALRPRFCAMASI